MAIRNKSPLKILEKVERGRIQKLSTFFGYPLLSRERVKLRTSNLASTFHGQSEYKPVAFIVKRSRPYCRGHYTNLCCNCNKNFGEKRA